jgi:hypothetical protein
LDGLALSQFSAIFLKSHYFFKRIPLFSKLSLFIYVLPVFIYWEIYILSLPSCL